MQNVRCYRKGNNNLLWSLGKAKGSGCMWCVGEGIGRRGSKVKDIPQGNSMCKVKRLRAHGLYEKRKIVWFNLRIVVMEGREMRNENK